MCKTKISSTSTQSEYFSLYEKNNLLYYLVDRLGYRVIKMNLQQQGLDRFVG